jgi:hypothetical protein
MNERGRLYHRRRGFARRAEGSQPTQMPWMVSGREKRMTESPPTCLERSTKLDSLAACGYNGGTAMPVTCTHLA